MKEFGTIADLINSYKALPCDAYIYCSKRNRNKYGNAETQRPERGNEDSVSQELSSAGL